MTSFNQVPPIKIPRKLLNDPELRGFFETLTNSLYQIWYAEGGQDGGVIPADRISEVAVTQHQGAIDHGSIAGLSDDDHTQYHNESRANSWFATKTNVVPTGGSQSQVLSKSTDTNFDTSWLSAATLISTTVDIDVTTTGTTILYTVPAGKQFVPLFVIIRVTNFTSGGKTTQAVVSFGGNASTYDDWLNSVTYTVNNISTFQIDRPSDATELALQSAGDSFRMSVETASDASTEAWSIDLFGYLV